MTGPVVFYCQYEEWVCLFKSILKSAIYIHFPIHFPNSRVPGFIPVIIFQNTHVFQNQLCSAVIAYETFVAHMGYKGYTFIAFFLHVERQECHLLAHNMDILWWGALT